MKRIIVYVLAAIALLGVGCQNNKSNAYSKDREKEKKLIANYVSRHGMNIISTLPEYGQQWAENDYYEIPGYDQLYMHVVTPGDTTLDPIIVGEKVIVRYRKYTMTEPEMIVEDHWTSLTDAFPVEFGYMQSSNYACDAWHYAIGLLKYPNGSFILICPSKWGFSEDTKAVVPYKYDMKVNVKR